MNIISIFVSSSTLINFSCNKMIEVSGLCCESDIPRIYKSLQVLPTVKMVLGQFDDFILKKQFCKIKENIKKVLFIFRDFLVEFT